jgi:hypothetical protein
MLITKLSRPGILIGLVIVLAMSVACPGEKANKDTEILVYSDESITFEYPDWPDVSTEEDGVFIFKSNGASVFSAARYPVPSTLLIREMKRNLGAVFSGEYGSFLMESDDDELKAITRVLYSNYETYALTVYSTGQPDKRLLVTAKCNKRPLKIKERTGIMPMPANGDATLLPQACREARSLGAEVIDWYFFWGDMEDGWTVADSVMECLSHEGKSAVVMNIIHTNVLGKYPPEFQSFVDPGFKEGFAEFSIEFVNRYKPDYYFIGGEVDIYLDMHRDEIPAFKEVLDYTCREIRKASPETRVGLVVTYHYARDHGALDIIRTLAPECDILGYTVHAYEGDYLYGDVSRGLKYLNEVRDVVPGKPYAIIETAWSSSALLDSSEDKQAEYVRDFFSFVNAGNAEFVIWFGLHDQPDCSEAAKIHLEPVPYLQVDDAYVKAFEEFMCSPGLKNPDDSPKKAWYIWQEYVQ